MKRPPPTFIVEVRKQRRSTSENGKSPLAGPGFARPAPPPQAAPAVVGAPPAPPSDAAATPPRPTGRILPSLVDLAPAPSAAAATPRRKRESLAATRKPRKTPQTRATPEADRGGAPPRGPAAEAIAEALAGAPPPTAAVEGVAATRPSRHRRVMERYVFGADREPGARWKRRLLAARE
jgi:hypothetical protein